jgi:hypothetical protein
VDREGARLDCGLGLRVAVEAADDELDLGFYFGEGGFCLARCETGVSVGGTGESFTCSSSTEAQSIRPVDG